MAVPGRRNGFSRPYSKPQLIAWFVLVATIVQFLFFVSPILPLAASIPVTLVFFAMVGGILYYGGLTQAVDPMDDHLRKHLLSVNPDAEAKLSSYYHHINPLREPNPDDPMKQCWLCDTQVAEPSMHCKFCDKCVKNFDHHCMWLNTCIGKENYRYFYTTMWFIFAMQITHVAVSIALVVNIQHGGTSYARANAWFHAGAADWVSGVLIFFICFDGISLFLLGQLIWFHLTLQRENLTTYAYIVRESSKRREKIAQEQQVQAKRVHDMAEARRQGRSAEAWALQCGMVARLCGCRACDPLELPAQELDVENPPASGAGSGFSSALGVHTAVDDVAEDSVEERPLAQSEDHNGGGVEFVKVNGDGKAPEPANDEANGGDDHEAPQPASETTEEPVKEE